MRIGRRQRAAEVVVDPADVSVETPADPVRPTPARPRPAKERKGRRFVDRVQLLMPEHGTVVVVGEALARVYPDAHVVDPASTDSELHVSLAALQGIDLVAIDRLPGHDRGVLLEQVMHHLRPGGVVVVSDVKDDSVAAVLSRLAQSMLTPAQDLPRREGRVVGSFRELELFDGHAELVCRRPAYVKLREWETNAYLALRGEAAGRVLRTLPAQEFLSRATIREAPSDLDLPIARHYLVPELSIREYRDVLAVPGQVALQGQVALPDTFRHNQRPAPGNRYFADLTERFGRPRLKLDSVETLQGSYFYLDSEFRGHYGHAMTEQLSRLWAWPEAKAAHPDLKLLLLVNRRTELYSYEQQLYGAAGVPDEDIVLAGGPVQVERLLAATPMFSQPEYIHPDIRPVWQRVSSSLAAGAGDAPVPQRIFCARRHGKRSCNNAAEVEAYFAERGFAIIYSEDFSLADQARIFRETEVVAGYAGSALFNLLFSERPKKVIMLSSEGYRAQNEYLISAVLGHDITVAWCRPDRPRRPGEGWSNQWFHSNFTYDFSREGRAVDEVLNAL